jgi:hypothetical protein
MPFRRIATMTQSTTNGLTRRQAVLGAAAIAALGRVTTTAAAVRSSRGIAGGGLVSLPDGVVNFSLFASRTASDDADDVVVGQVRWIVSRQDEPDLVLESVEVTGYRPLDDDENGRELRGTMRLADAEHPFVMLAFDNGTPGSAQDRVSLTVGAGVGDGTAVATATDADVEYEADGAVVAGDIQLLEFEIG